MEPALTTRVALLERGHADHDRRLLDVEETQLEQTKTLTAIVTRVGIYAAIGAVIGGAVVSGIAALLLKAAG